MECLFTCHCPESGQLSGLSCLWWRAYTHTLEISGSDFLDLSFSLYTAAFIQQFIPPYICRMISFTIFFMIGLSSLFQGTIKSFLGTYKRKKLSFEYSGISFVLDIYLDETKADADNSKLLSLKEALYLAVALSIDSLASGFALGISIVQPLPVLVISFCVGILAILGGSFLGSRVLSLKECRLSWVSGVLFLILAFSRIL